MLAIGRRSRVVVQYCKLHRTVPQRGEKELLASTRTKKLSSRATPKDRKQKASIKKPTKRNGGDGLLCKVLGV